MSADEKQLHKLILLAPISGESQPLAMHYEPSISHGLQGQGVMLSPLGSRLVAPCDGVITDIAPTSHRIMMQGALGTKVELTCGNDAIHTHGVGFNRKVNIGQRVNAGDILLELDLINIKKHMEHFHIALLLRNGVVTTKPHYGPVRSNEDKVLTGIIKQQ